MQTIGADNALYGIVVAAIISVGFIAVAFASVDAQFWRFVPVTVFRVESLVGLVLLLSYAVQFLRLRMASPDIHVRLFIPIVILLTGTATALCGVLGFRMNRLGMWLVGASALAPLTLCLIRFLDD